MTESDQRAPLIVGRYAIFDSIAAGGMATVHLGRLLGEVGFTRTVAIKRLHKHFASDHEFVSMFIDEARIAARVRHPNVVQTLDVGAIDGELFVVMDYVEGESLSRIFRSASANGKLVDPSLVARIMVDTLHGLHAAHEAKNEAGEPLEMVHRDVSPQNVLVGVDGISRVLDFGIAKAVGQVHTTQKGELKGKIAYMAPEQLRGEDVTRRTDVFAASIMFWELLVGRRLFGGGSEGEVVHKVLQADVTRPSERVPSLPSAIDAVVMRGLARDPSARYASAAEMAEAIEACIAPASPRAVGAWAREHAAEPLAQRARLLAAIESGTSVAVPTSEDSKRIAAEAARAAVNAVNAEHAVHTARMSSPVEAHPDPSHATSGVTRLTYASGTSTRAPVRPVVLACALGVALVASFVVWRAASPSASETSASHRAPEPSASAEAAASAQLSASTQAADSASAQPAASASAQPASAQLSASAQPASAQLSASAQPAASASTSRRVRAPAPAATVSAASTSRKLYTRE